MTTEKTATLPPAYVEVLLSVGFTLEEISADSERLERLFERAGLIGTAVGFKYSQQKLEKAVKQLAEYSEEIGESFEELLTQFPEAKSALRISFTEAEFPEIYKGEPSDE